MVKKKRVAINGFGRMGRLITRHLLGFPDIELVAINGHRQSKNSESKTDIQRLAILFKRDSTHGSWPHPVEVKDNTLVITSSQKRVVKERGSSILQMVQYRKHAVQMFLEE